MEEFKDFYSIAMGLGIEIFSSTGYKFTSHKINSTLKKDLAQVSNYYNSNNSIQ